MLDGDRRILGYDNLGGWHRHPPEDPHRHDDCEEPTLEAFLREAVNLVT